LEKGQSLTTGNKIIGICGLIGSGKGTVADKLFQDYGFQPRSFASALKDGVAGIFGYDRNMLEGDTSESREAREQVDPFWSDVMGREITPRYILQIMGTEIMRQNFHDDIWVKIVERDFVMSTNQKFVVSDVRFLNEINMIRKCGGEIWWIKRGNWPEWVSPWREMGIEPEDIHQSEYMWMMEEPDRVILNNGDLSDLYDTIDEALEE
jgi:hypothetical protein